MQNFCMDATSPSEGWQSDEDMQDERGQSSLQQGDASTASILQELARMNARITVRPRQGEG